MILRPLNEKIKEKIVSKRSVCVDIGNIDMADNSEFSMFKTRILEIR